MTPSGELNEDDAAMAAEYALGLLEPAEHAAFEARLALEPDLRAAYGVWAEGLVSLTDDIAPQKPPRRVKTAVMETLFGPEKPAPWWKPSLALLGGAVTAGVLALALLVVFGRVDPAQPALVAEIQAGDQSFLVQASYSAVSGALNLTQLPETPEAGRAYELWLIADGQAPVSLGVLSHGPTSTHQITAELAPLLPGATLAISDEPTGGSPTGAPTGAVLATGLISSV